MYAIVSSRCTYNIHFTGSCCDKISSWPQADWRGKGSSNSHHTHVNLSVSQLVLVGVVEEDVGLSLLQDMLSSLVRSNEVEHPYLAVMVSFARHFAEDIAGITPRKHRMMFTKFKMKPRLAQVSRV